MQASCILYGQHESSFILPDSIGWNVIPEGQVISFQVRSTHGDSALFSLEGAEGLDIQFDTVGNFFWKPSFDLVDRVAKSKEFTVVL